MKWLAKLLSVLFVSYWIGWTISFFFLVGDSAKYYFSYLVDVWSGDAFVRQASTQILALIVMWALTKMYYLCEHARKQKKRK